MAENQTEKRVNADDKRLINCNQVDVNQLMPLKYKWAWEHYVNGCANHWMPSEVPMAKDIEYADSGRKACDHAQPRVFQHGGELGRQQHRARDLQTRHQS
jgi:Ribonucleotide reductase, small chain